MGGGSNDAQREAEEAERRRRAQIDAGVRQVDSIYSSPERQQQYADFLDANRQLYTGELNRKNEVNNRELKFALSRNGQAGSSVQRDEGRRAGEVYNRGVIQADRLAQGAEANLRDQDNASRLQLVNLLQSGLDVTSAANQAAQALRTSLQAGQGGMLADGLGDLFGGFSDIYERSRKERERRQALEDYDLLYKPAYK